MPNEQLPFERRKIAPADEHLEWVRARRDRQLKMIDEILTCPYFAPYSATEKNRIAEVASAAFAELNARERAAANLAERLAGITMTILGLAAAVVSVWWSGASSWTGSWWLSLFLPLIGVFWLALLFGSLYIPLYGLWWKWKAHKGAKSGRDAGEPSLKVSDGRLGALSALCFILILSATLYLIFAGPSWGAMALSGLVIGSVWFVVSAVSYAVFDTIGWRFIRTDPRAVLICQMVELVALIAPISTTIPLESFRDKWRSARNPQVELAYLLNEAGRGIEKRLRNTAPRALGYGRIFLSGQAARVAAGFRIHAQMVLLNGWEYREKRLSPSLAAGLSCAAFGNWSGLAGAEPISLSKRFVANLGRFILAALLLVFAFTVPQLIAGGEYVVELRGVLFAAAALVLATPKQAAGKLADKATDLFFPQK